LAWSRCGGAPPARGAGGGPPPPARDGNATGFLGERVCTTHRLNMELDLQSLFGLHVYSCTYWLAEAPQLPPPAIPPHLGAICQLRLTTSLCEPPGTTEYELTAPELLNAKTTCLVPPLGYSLVKSRGGSLSSRSHH
jgi:hypothetical protein